MNFDGERNRREEPEGALFQAVVAAVVAVGFIALFLI